MMRCGYCGNDVDEATISRHGFCIPCMDRIVDESDAWSGPLDELLPKMKGYAHQITTLRRTQQEISGLLHEVQDALRKQRHIPIRQRSSMSTCEYCGRRFWGLKLHQLHCLERPNTKVQP